MTSGEFLKQKSRAKCSWSRSHVTTIIQNFTLVSLNSSLTLHPVGLPLGAVIPSLPTHLSPYALVSLCTCLLIHSSPYALVSLRTCLPTYLSYCYVRIPARRTFCLGIYLRLSTCQSHPWSLQYSVRKLSCRLDAIDACLLCDSQPRHQYQPKWLAR